jgi:putative spermidine/putrescine transport system permease protein
MASVNPIGQYVAEGAILRLMRRPGSKGGSSLSRSGRFPVWRWVILLVAGVYFLLPLYAALRFAGIKAFGSVFTQPGFGAALWVSIQIGAMTWIITMALMVPTTIYVHLAMPRLRALLESITILPIVIPPIVLTVGVLQVFPVQLKATMWLLGIEYVILAMPFAYRAIDAGLRSIDLKTLTEASSNLGASWATTIWRVILPNLGTSLLSATVLIVALCLGEFTMASLNLVTTFPVWIVEFDQLNAQISVSASILALVVTWLFLMLIVTIGSRHSRRTGAGEVTLFTVTANTKTIGES